ncbi:MAG: hypothetical protein HQL76_13225 [Magnetococcales bacterium]|nr:hypothetical protein [Magnetococcales bacterium]
MIQILPSADYELYLGRNRLPEEEVLIQPTERLLGMYEDLGLRTTLFCDVACIWRYREWGREAFAARMERQMIEAVQRGHDVQAHLHPHWLTTEWSDEGYRFPPEHYLLGTLEDDWDRCLIRVENLARRAIDHLERLLRPVDPDYRCIAFRAGGYGLQPRDRMVLAALIQAGFAIDSSIIPGLILRSAPHQVDFSHTPQRANYWLGPRDGILKPAHDGEGLLEIPIPSIHLSPWKGWFLNIPEALRQGWSILAKKDPDTPRGDPCGATGTTAATTTASRWRRAYWRTRAMANTRFHRLEAGTSLRILKATFDGYLDRFADGEVLLSINCHPKGMTPRHYTVLRQFHQWTQRHPTREVSALTFQEAWKRRIHAITKP